MVEGEEIFGYEPAAVLKPSGEYNDETDLIFYKEPKQSGAVLYERRRFCYCSAGGCTCTETYVCKRTMPGKEDCGKS